HPDDESLACGGLIQRAVQAGALVTVVVATGGDANPWPQRLAERRWRLGPDAAARWGARRMSEARDALRVLGVDEAHTHFLHWRDQGLTRRLQDQPQESTHALRALVEAARPTLVVAPALQDSHPDHSALAVLVRATLRGCADGVRVLAYWLHGRPADARGTRHFVLSADELARKREAVLMHRSQLQFGRWRLLAHVRQHEDFFDEPTPPPAPAPAEAWRWRFHAPNRLAALGHRDLRVVAVTSAGEVRSATYDLRDRAHGLAVRRAGDVLEAAMAPPWADAEWAIAKLDHRHRVFVYDTCAWQHARDPAADPARAIPGKGGERHFANPVPSHPREPDMRPWKILCDFDGTICLPDATDALLERLADPAWKTLERQWREGLMGSRDCMTRQVELIDASMQDVEAVLDGIEVDPAFPAFVARARALGVELSVVSDGLDLAIRTLLRRHGLDDLPLVANHFEQVSARGWRFSSPHADAGCRAESGTCKCAWAARAQDVQGGARILVIGDGQSDVCVAERADFVFAKSRLLAHCRATGLNHRPIDGFHDALALLPDLVAGRLDADASLPIFLQAEYA
ncbi:MAG: MtnX-like HAD-IB family phosphatase, partial [Lysobacter sp.]|nr:MtnX-like HAD-IB family phosphatase [Lysobacter sp.]